MIQFDNPVYDGPFADPFVWEAGGRYYAVGTGPVPDGLAGSTPGAWAFPLLQSDDFCHWRLHGAALQVPAFARGGDFWAPEVACEGGRFFLYYSVATEGLKHRLRVAVSERPEGPYHDLQPLMQDPESCPFAIDAHPFRDEDGTWHLFYARDFLDTDGSVRAGTALVVDRLESMVRLAGRERLVLRSRCDWHLFRAQRPMYGQIFDWHTLEGPAVRKRGGKYYCLFSGGCYENETYGVDYAVADTVEGPYSDEGGERGPRVLRTVPGRVLGPGHLSIVTGPDGGDYIAYHAWDPGMTARRMFMDPLIWTPDGPRCPGPSLKAAPVCAQANG
jgi:beta-xylosidase